MKNVSDTQAYSAFDHFFLKALRSVSHIVSVRPGELVALDTDTIGCYGYYSDFSRIFRCGPGKPTAYQKSLYRVAHDQVQHNISIVKPGMAFREIAERAWKIPERLVEQRYTSVMHGVCMHGETPFIAHAMDYATYGRDGHILPGMVVSVESYIGEKGGREGVKLEDEILITDTGNTMSPGYIIQLEIRGSEIQILGTACLHLPQIENVSNRMHRVSAH